MGIADVLSDAAREIRDYLADNGLKNYGNDAAREIMYVVGWMEALRVKIDAMDE
jgi:hypothetical protein